MDLQIGSMVGDYQVVGILGAGGMGKVFKVRNVISDRLEAMKVLLPDLMHAPELADRFLREIKVLAALEHPHIAGLHTALRVDNQLLMLMEFVDGVTLEQQLTGGPMPMADALNYMGQTLSALDYAHAHNVVHRDIKPANIMLTPSGVIKLMDFGIAKAVVDKRLTATGLTMGSLYYMSPEQIQGAATLDSRADIYSAGVTLYEMVTGKKPFDGDSQFAIMAAHLAGTPAPPVSVDPKLPQALNDAILMSVAKAPGDRFQTAAAFGNAIRNIASPAPPPEPAAAAVVAVAPPPVPQRNSKRGLWMGLGAVAAVAAVVAAIQLAPKNQTDAAGRNVPPAKVQVATPHSDPAHSDPAHSDPAHIDPVQPQLPPDLTPSKQVIAPPLQPTDLNAKTPAKQPRDTARAPQITQNPGPTPTLPAQNPPPTPAIRQEQQVTPTIPTQTAPQHNLGAANQAQLQEVRQQVAMLDVRANGIRDSLGDLQRSQRAMGVGMSSKFQGPADLMNVFMKGAVDALNAGDAASAKSLMDKAERQVEILEKLLNR